MRINQNVLSIQTHATLSQTNTRLEKSIAKLSSGLRINSAADDAAGLSISEKLRRQIKGLSKAISNSQDGISMIQTAEGALGESHSILQRMRELAIQASNDTLTTNDRLEIQKEVVQLKDDINRISRNTEFNTKKLLDGSQMALISGSSNSAKGIVTGDISGVSGDYDVSITLEQGGTSQLQQTQIFTKVSDGGSTVAKGSDELRDISQFYDSNGVFVLESQQTVTIQGNGKTTSFVIDGHTTLDQLAANIQSAVRGDSGLGMSTATAKFVSTSTENPTGGGYMQIDSGAVGKDGSVNFLADQSVINALGLSTIRDAANNVYSVQINNGAGYGQKVYTDTNRVAGLLNGVDVAFQSQAAQIAGIGGVVDGLNFQTSADLSISVGGYEIDLSISGGSNWTMEGLERYFNYRIASAAASGVSAAIVDGELRVMFNPPSSYTGNTTIVVSNDSDGTNTLGLENGTYSGYIQTNKLESSVTKMISKYYGDAGANSVYFSISVGDASEEVSVFVTVSVLSTADGVKFSAFQANVNNQLKVATVAARIDLAGDSMVFSSTRVGRVNASTIESSRITLLAGGQATTGDDYVSATESFMKDWGFDGIDGLNPIVSIGQGDSNFKLHIVNTNSQLQIGADQGQVLKFGMVEMGAEALGVDNLNLTSIEGANNALNKINIAIDRVSAERSKLGAYQNRLEYAINNLRTMHSNTTSAESRIRDADIANEMIEFTRNQIVAQSGTAMLAQANTVPQSVMQLLR